jgi:uncharacterized protein HemX
MKRQSGISTAGLALVLVVIAAGAGGFFGWQQHQELGRTRSELALTKSSLDKASAEARAAKTDAAAARKELEEQKAALQQARSEAENLKAFLDTEKAHSVRLQADLALAREQIAYLRTRGAAAYVPSQQMPMTVRPAPSRIEAIQVQRSAPQAVGAGAPAQAQPAR